LGDPFLTFPLRYCSQYAVRIRGSGRGLCEADGDGVGDGVGVVAVVGE
jgi:hypothetical protein